MRLNRERVEARCYSAYLAASELCYERSEEVLLELVRSLIADCDEQ